MKIFQRREAYLVQHGEEVVAEHYGRQYEPSSYLEWGSITKPVTAHAIAVLVERGELDYDRPVREVIDALPASVTVRALTRHTSGVPRVHAGMPAGVLADPYRDTGREVVLGHLREVGEHDLVAPGTVTYSNLGFAALGLVIEKVTGTPWFDAVRDLVFEPWGLDEVAIDPPIERRAQINGFDRKPHRPWDLAGSAYNAAGALWSPLRVLARYGRLVMSSGGLAVPERAWQHDHGRYWHNGQTRDAGACLVMDPAADVVVATATLARLPGAADKLARRLVEQAVAAA